MVDGAPIEHQHLPTFTLGLTSTEHELLDMKES